MSATGGFTAGGIQGQYFASTDLSGPVAFQRQDVRIDFDWGTVLTPGGANSLGFNSIGHNNFSVRWTGQVVAGNSQTYIFTDAVDAADGTRLLIRPAGSTTWTTLVNDWTTVGTSTAASFAMTAGATYDVEMDYFHSTGAAKASLHWSGAGTPDEAIGPVGITGINAETYGPQIYADAMKSGRTSWEGQAAQDANGWPLEDATNIPWEGVDPATVAGTYLLTFNGEAQVSFIAGGTPIVVAGGNTYHVALPKGAGYDPATNTTTATVTFGNDNAGILNLQFVNTQRTATSAVNTGVTNVQLMRPTSPGASTYYAPGTLFAGSALTAMSAFTTERWNTTNGDITQTNWSDRVLPGYFKADFGSSNEVWENLVMFSNATGKDLYVTVPVNASSTYVTNLAELIKYGSDGVNPYTSPQAQPAYPGLNPNLKVYVEWSNETWNWGFPQQGAGVRASAAAVLNNTPEGPIINYDGSSPNGNWQRWFALKTVEASNTFRTIWGDAAMGNSVRVLLEYQYYNLQDTAYTQLGFINNYFDNGDGQQHVTTPHPVGYYLWGAGGPSYFGFVHADGAQSAITVADSSFESPAVAAGTDMMDPLGTGWTFSGNSGIYNAGTNYATVGPLGHPAVAPDGNQAAFIGDTGSISTTINFNSTGVFAIQLYAANKLQSPDAIHIYLDGQEITPNGANYVATSNAWTPGAAPGLNQWIYNGFGTAPFTISTTGNHVLTIVGVGAAGTYTYIDNVKVASETAIFNSGMLAVATVDTYPAEMNLEARYAEEYGLHVVAYEGGWLTAGLPIFSYAMYVDPRAVQSTVQSINEFAQAGGSLDVMGTIPAWPAADMANAGSYPIVQGVEAANAALPAARTTPAPHLFLDTSQPTTSQQNVYNSTIAAAGGAELGMKFRSDESGYVTGVRFWAGTQNLGAHTGELWSSSGQLLATATFSASNVGGWQQVYFSAPVAISANTTYVVSYHTTSPNVADTPGAFATAGIDNLNLHGLASGVDGNNGVFALGSASAFPVSSDGTSSNYWVDAIFSDHVPVAPTAPFDFKATPNSSTAVAITWTDSAGEVTAYQIERSTDGVNYKPLAQVFGQNQYVDSNLLPNTTYYYRMSAQNAGSFSWTEVTQTTTPNPATGTFAALDTTTQGTWTGTYGADGYEILGSDTTTPSLPAYARLSFSGQQSWVWQQSSTDPRAAQTAPGSGTRIASCLFAANSFTINLSLTDGQTHQVALYLSNYDQLARSETVQVTDPGNGKILDTRSVSNFSGGQWLVWDLSGYVSITLTNTGWPNAVASAIAFDRAPVAAPPAAAFVASDSTTQGSWSGIYGADGYSIVNGQANLPAYAHLSTQNALNWVWEFSTADTRAPQVSSGSSTRTAACDYSITSFSLDLNLTDGQTHRVGLYAVDYDKLSRAQTFQISDAVTGTFLDTRSISGFVKGQWLFWNLTGHVKITITCTSGADAVVSGIVFDPPAVQAQSTASFVKTDSATQGHWTGTYGSDGYSVFAAASKLPSYAQVTPLNNLSWTWETNSADPRALQTTPGSSTGIGACYFSLTSFTLDVNLTDGKAHQLAMYLVDYDRLGRSETVQVTDAASGSVLDTRNVANFQGGQYLVWNVSGHVRITITCTAGVDGVASGLFFDPSTPGA